MLGATTRWFVAHFLGEITLKMESSVTVLSASERLGLYRHARSPINYFQEQILLTIRTALASQNSRFSAIQEMRRASLPQDGNRTHVCDF
jgi:hypothetical protein